MEFKFKGKTHSKKGIPFYEFETIDVSTASYILCLRDDSSLQRSLLCSGNPVSHLIISEKNIFDLSSLEPYYNRKVEILRETGKWGQIALEVFPAQKDVVDREDVYHMWEFEFPYSCKFFPVANEANRLNLGPGLHNFCDGNRIIVTNAQRWKEKQDLKNRLLGKQSTAIEFITDHFIDAKSIIVEIPFIDFSLS